jgi:tRNA modification GTPase
MEDSTIVAIATPPGHGGIGIIKISGPESIPIGLSIFRPIAFSPGFAHRSSHLPVSFSPESRYLYYGNVIDSNNPARIIDEALFVVMRAPCSYTGEDIVEIQTHAGPVVLRSIIRSVIEKGIRLAAPGEFTRRAFLNGRIDLTQAEAVADLINARSEKAIDMAAAQISGKLNIHIASLSTSLLDIFSYVEAAIDFPDEVGDDINVSLLKQRLEFELIVKIRALIARSNEQSFFRDGLKIVIIGAPNVGKSSLMNRLVNKERSIVTDLPGTTRDFIEESFVISGVPVVLTDTAGIHEQADLIEQIGIEKAWDSLSGADIILFTIDASQPVTSDIFSLYNRIDQKKTFIVINKIDLVDDQKLLELTDAWTAKGVQCIQISALYDQGIHDLKSLIADSVLRSEVTLEDTVVPNLRHKLLLEKALLSLELAVDGFDRMTPFELISIDLKFALDALSEITGENIKPDILDNIFSRFCIGK